MAAKKRLGTDPFTTEKTSLPESVTPGTPAVTRQSGTTKSGTRTSPNRSKKAASAPDSDEIRERLARLESEMKALERQVHDLQRAASCMNPFSWWRYWFPF